jgi:CheY-like chemotaxis protein
MIQEAIQYPALINYLKGFSNYTWLHYCDGRKILVAKSLGFFEGRLSGFLRIHKTVLVNPHYIASFEAPPGSKMPGSVILKDGTRLPVSRRRWSLVIEPMNAALSLSSFSFQPKENPVLPDQTASVPKPATQLFQNQSWQQMWIVMSDEIKGELVRQFIGERWPAWHLQLFDTGPGLQKALPGIVNAEMPALIILDASQAGSMQTLKFMKQSPRFRFIPIILLTSEGSHDLIQQGYALGANSVIVHPIDLTRFIQILEKMFQYWLSMVSAPTPVTSPSLV